MKIARKALKVTGIVSGSLVVLIVLIPFLFPGIVANQIRRWASNNIRGEVNFSKARLSFFDHFPSLTLTFHDFSLNGAPPFEKEILVASNEIGLGVDLKKLIFRGKVVINKLYLTNAQVKMKVNEKGEANYNVYISNDSKTEAKNENPSSATIRIQNILITNCHFVYDDSSVGVLLDARDFNYEGKGKLEASVLSLLTHASIKEFDFYLDKEPYLVNKQINADLITKINTNSLALIFEKNKLNINNLPLEFTGRFDFLDKGYDMDFSITSGRTTLYNLVTALPPQYITWLQKTTLKGETQIRTSLKGQYIASGNIKPAYTLHLDIKDGYVAYENAPLPASGILLNLDVNMPSLSTDSLLVKVDTLSLTAGMQHIHARFATRGLAPSLSLNGSIKAKVDLAQLDKILGLTALYAPGNEIAGGIKADLRFRDSQSDIDKQHYDRLDNQGTLELDSITLSAGRYFQKPFLIRKGKFSFKQDKMWFSDFLAGYGRSDLRMNGYLENVLNYALSEKGVLKGSFQLNSRLFDVDEFMVSAVKTDSLEKPSASSPAAATGVVMIPSNLDLQVNTRVDKVLYNDLALRQLKGDLSLNGAKASLKGMGFELIGCAVSMDAAYTGIAPEKAQFDYHITAADFDVQKAYKEVKLFKDMVATAATAEGIVSLDYSLKGDLDQNMRPVFSTLSGGGVLSLKDVKIKRFKLFNAVSAKTGSDGIKDPELRKIDLKTTIRHNVLTLERVKMKVAGFRPRIEGQTSFDGRISFKMRLGLPPLGIIGIPLTVRGTMDKPQIRLGRKTEDLSEGDKDE